MFDDSQILAFAQLPESCLKFRIHVENLISFYQFLREQWTAQAIDQFKQQHGLDLRKPSDRARFGWLAAQEWVACLPAAPEPVPPETKVVKVLCQALALLPPVPKTNSLEYSEPYQIFQSPVYFDELVSAYRQLAQRWHPDTNFSPEAVERFQIINNVYKTLKNEWVSKYSPLIPAERIGQENIQRAYAKRFPFSAESFWR